MIAVFLGVPNDEAPKMKKRNKLLITGFLAIIAAVVFWQLAGGMGMWTGLLAVCGALVVGVVAWQLTIDS